MAAAKKRRNPVAKAIISDRVQTRRVVPVVKLDTVSVVRRAPVVLRAPQVSVRVAEKPQRVALPRVLLSRPAFKPVVRDPRKAVAFVADVRRVDLLRPAAVSFDAVRRDPVKDRVTCKERPDARVRSLSGSGGRKVDFIPWCS